MADLFIVCAKGKSTTDLQPSTDGNQPLVQYETSQQLREEQLLEAIPFVRSLNLERASCTPAFLQCLTRWGV
jgi:hypothetical protein